MNARAAFAAAGRERGPFAAAGRGRARFDAAARAVAARKGLQLRLAPSIVVASAAMVAVACVVAAGGSGVALAVAAGVGAAAPPVALACWPDRRAARLDASVPALLDATARSLRAGRSLGRAFADAAAEAADPLAAEARAVVLRVDSGVGFGAALRHAAAAAPAPGWRTALVAVAIAHEAGGPQAMVLDSLAASLRARQAARRELRALTTPVRVSALLIALAPLGVLGAVAALDPGALRAAYASPAGRGAAVLGLLLDAAGFWWIRALTRFA